jgi:hypothetical protein
MLSVEYFAVPYGSLKKSVLGPLYINNLYFDKVEVTVIALFNYFSKNNLICP